MQVLIIILLCSNLLIFSCVSPLQLFYPHRNANLHPKVYVSSAKSNRIAVIDPRVQAVREIIHVNHKILDMAISPDDKLLAVSRSGQNDILLFDTETDSLLQTFSMPGAWIPIKLIFSNNSRIIVLTKKRYQSLLHNINIETERISKFYDKQPCCLSTHDHAFLSISYEKSLLCITSGEQDPLKDGGGTSPAFIMNYESKQMLSQLHIFTYYGLISPDGTYVYGQRFRRHPFRYHINKRQYEQLEEINPFSGASFFPDGNHLLI